MTTTTTTTTNESTPSSSDRLAAEISLLEAMYPDSVTFNRKSLELTYRIMGQYSQPRRSKRTGANDSTTGGGGVLVLRLPRNYPDDGGGGGGVPELISACDGTKRDVRDSTRRAIADLNLEEGVEVLDQILATFEGVVSLSSSDSRVSGSSSTANPNHIDSSSETITDRDHDDDDNNNNDDDGGVDTSGNGTPELKLSPPSKTVIIWLHHLLATSKRKLALSPSFLNSNSNTTTTATISGMTKPGYPGVFIFSGPRDLVDSHVKELKGLNWQAFSKRYDSDEDTNGLFSSSNTIEIVDDTTKPTKLKRKQNVSAADDGEWSFTHGRNKIVEVESMAELVKGIVEEHHRDIFLRAVGVK